MSDQYGFRTLSLDQTRKELKRIWEEKKNDLDNARVGKVDLGARQREAAAEGLQPDTEAQTEMDELDRDIVIFGNEEKILKCLLNIYDLIAKPNKTPADEEKLKAFLTDLYQSYHPDKLKIKIQYIVDKAKVDGSSK